MDIIKKNRIHTAQQKKKLEKKIERAKRINKRIKVVRKVIKSGKVPVKIAGKVTVTPVKIMDKGNQFYNYWERKTTAITEQQQSLEGEFFYLSGKINTYLKQNQILRKKVNSFIEKKVDKKYQEKKQLHKQQYAIRKQQIEEAYILEKNGHNIDKKKKNASQKAQSEEKNKKTISNKKKKQAEKQVIEREKNKEPLEQGKQKNSFAARREEVKKEKGSAFEKMRECAKEEKKSDFSKLREKTSSAVRSKKKTAKQMGKEKVKKQFKVNAWAKKVGKKGGAVAKLLGKNFLSFLGKSVKKYLLIGIVGFILLVAVVISPVILIVNIIDSPKNAIELILGGGSGNEDSAYREQEERLKESLNIVKVEVNKRFDSFEADLKKKEEAGKHIRYEEGGDLDNRRSNLLDICLLYNQKANSLTELDEELLEEVFQSMVYSIERFETNQETGKKEKVSIVVLLKVNDLKNKDNEAKVVSDYLEDNAIKEKFLTMLDLKIELPNIEVPENLGEVLSKVDATTPQYTAIEYAIHALGTIYSQEKRNQEGYHDCSSLTARAYRKAGINLSFGGADTAAAQMQKLDTEGKSVSSENELQPGDLIFYSYVQNGRYKNVSHVGIYIGDGLMIDASNAQGKVVCRPIIDKDKIVGYGRPF